MPFQFDNHYARLPEYFFARQDPIPVAAPSWVAVNPRLGAILGLKDAELRSDVMLEVFAGNRVPEGAENVIIYDVTGRIVSDASRSGIYFARFFYEGRKNTVKLIKP